MISAYSLTKFYGDRCAVNGIDFEIADGEIVGFLGLNGAGKTTTLKILACLLLPSAGSVKVNDIDVTETPHEVRKLVGFLPESPPLYNEMTTAGFLLFAAQLRGMSKDKAADRLDEVLELTDLTGVRDQVIGTLSHGYRQRVGIAQAIVHDPAVLILDEPIKGLDPVQIVEIREMIRGLKGRHTILLSSHILPEISQTVDRILMIKDGEIVAQGTEEELTAKLASGVRLSITFRGDDKELRAALTKLDHVQRVEAARQSTTDGTQLTLIADDDIRAEVAKTIVEGGFDLLHLSHAEQELEQAFVRLTGGRRGAVAAGAAVTEADDDDPADTPAKAEPAEANADDDDAAEAKDKKEESP
ncbi:MAG: ABC transporter ATP-binding protein [Proteobacteria bacterium]|nr:MAG: ABC transporter ATP-binding protein [Pseudomonadota bacterium]PIE18552.1 MAG: ABC transporter ATP-binding protein [Pseudomonadota bacterium]